MNRNELQRTVLWRYDTLPHGTVRCGMPEIAPLRSVIVGSQRNGGCVRLA